jgi:SH3-like domain-containing protein
LPPVIELPTHAPIFVDHRLASRGSPLRTATPIPIALSVFQGSGCMQNSLRPSAFPLFVLSTLIALLAIAPAAFAQRMVSISAKEANMRSGPGTKYETDWTLGQGYPLRVIGRQGKWLKVSDFENDSGWIYGPLTGSTPMHIVKAKIANLRSLPSTESRIVGKVSYGDVLKTLERRESWVKVQREGGLKGWIAKRLLWGW